MRGLLGARRTAGYEFPRNLNVLGLRLQVRSRVPWCQFSVCGANALRGPHTARLTAGAEIPRDVGLAV